MRAVRAVATPDARLLELTILTGNRAGSVRLMRFDQISPSRPRVARAASSTENRALSVRRIFPRAALQPRARNHRGNARVLASLRARVPRFARYDDHQFPSQTVPRWLLDRSSFRAETSRPMAFAHRSRAGLRKPSKIELQPNSALAMSISARSRRCIMPDDLLAERRELLDAWCLYCSGATADVQQLRA